MCKFDCMCGKGIARCMLIIFNIIFILTGVVLLAVSLWVRLDEDIWELLDILQVDSEDRFIEYGTYMLIAVGGLILIGGIVGCCGACMENTCLLGVYCGLLGLVMIIEIVCAVLVLVFRQRAKGEVIDKLKDSYDSDYYYRDDKWSAFARTTNLAQYQFECCGINGPSDYEDIKQHVDVSGPFCNAPSGDLYPATCFELNSDGRNEFPDEVKCGNVNKNKLHSEGCEDDILDFFEDYALIFIGLALGFAFLEIFGLIFTICLCRCKDKD